MNYAEMLTSTNRRPIKRRPTALANREEDLAMTTLLLAVWMIWPGAAAAPPTQSPTATVLGPKNYCDGDVIEITDVRSTSPRLEQGDSITVRGRYRLDSHAEAQLALYLTQTEGDGHEETERTQTINVEQGSGDFELKITIKHRGALHLSYYNMKTLKPFGGVYFGTPEQMERIKNWKLGPYASDD